MTRAATIYTKRLSRAHLAEFMSQPPEPDSQGGFGLRDGTPDHCGQAGNALETKIICVSLL